MTLDPSVLFPFRLGKSTNSRRFGRDPRRPEPFGRWMHSNQESHHPLESYRVGPGNKIVRQVGASRCNPVSILYRLIFHIVPEFLRGANVRPLLPSIIPIVTRLESERIAVPKRIIVDVTVQVNAAVVADRIAGEKPAGVRIVIAVGQEPLPPPSPSLLFCRPVSVSE